MSVARNKRPARGRVSSGRSLRTVSVLATRSSDRGSHGDGLCGPFRACLPTRLTRTHLPAHRRGSARVSPVGCGERSGQVVDQAIDSDCQAFLRLVSTRLDLFTDLRDAVGPNVGNLSQAIEQPGMLRELHAIVGGVVRPARRTVRGIASERRRRGAATDRANRTVSDGRDIRHRHLLLLVWEEVNAGHSWTLQGVRMKLGNKGPRRCTGVRSSSRPRKGVGSAVPPIRSAPGHLPSRH